MLLVQITASGQGAGARQARRPQATVVVVTERERIDYEWDWLGNQVGWDDDASSFYERSLGTITNGRTEEGEARPSALYLATNIDNAVLACEGDAPSRSPAQQLSLLRCAPKSSGIEGGWDGAGWVEVDYGDSGNVESFTVHGECRGSARAIRELDAAKRGYTTRTGARDWRTKWPSARHRAH